MKAFGLLTICEDMEGYENNIAFTKVKVSNGDANWKDLDKFQGSSDIKKVCGSG